MFRLSSGSIGTPGTTQVGRFALPLGFDSWLVASYLGNLPPFAANFQGSLDTAGWAQASLSPPPRAIPSAMVGNTFHFFALCGPPNGNWKYAAAPIPILIAH